MSKIAREPKVANTCDPSAARRPALVEHARPRRSRVRDVAACTVVSARDRRPKQAEEAYPKRRRGAGRRQAKPALERLLAETRVSKSRTICRIQRRICAGARARGMGCFVFFEMAGERNVRSRDAHPAVTSFVFGLGRDGQIGMQHDDSQRRKRCPARQLRVARTLQLGAHSQ